MNRTSTISSDGHPAETRKKPSGFQDHQQARKAPKTSGHRSSPYDTKSHKEHDRPSKPKTVVTGTGNGQSSRTLCDLSFDSDDEDLAKQFPPNSAYWWLRLANVMTRAGNHVDKEKPQPALTSSSTHVNNAQNKPSL